SPLIARKIAIDRYCPPIAPSACSASLSTAGGRWAPCRLLKMRFRFRRIRRFQKQMDVRLAADAGELAAIEVTRLERFLTVGRERPIFVSGAEHRAHPRDSVAVRVRGGTDVAAEHADDMRQRNIEAGLLPHLAHGRIRRR